MSELKPRIPMRKMSIDEALNNTMTFDAWKAYLALHKFRAKKKAEKEQKKED